LSSAALAYRLSSSWLNPNASSYLIYFVTAACNAKCESCFYWKETDSASPQNELTPEETAKIAEHLPPLVQLTLSGGEPFLREDLVELVQPLIEKAAPCFLSIPTNGILTERIVKTAETLATRYPRLRLNIELSLDGIGQAHDQLRARPGAFENLMATWRALKSLQPNHKNLRLGILTVLSGLNRGDIFETLKYIKGELKPERMEVLFARGEPRNPAAIQVSIDQFKEVNDWLEKESPRPKTLVDRIRWSLAEEKRNLIINTVSKNQMILPCLAGKKLVVLEPDGRVRPCEILSSRESRISNFKFQISDLKSQTSPNRSGPDNFWLGSLRESDYDLRRILRSEQAKKVLSFIESGGCHCSYECAALADLAFRPKRMFRIFLRSLLP